MDISSTVAKNLKNIRDSKRLSLDTVAKLSGVSKSMLGQIERGEVNPTISVLWKIANGLKVSFTSFVERESDNTTLIRANEIQQLIEDDGKFVNNPLFPFDEKLHFETFRVDLKPGGKRNSEAHMSGTLEIVTVFKGSIIISSGDEVFTLNEKDSIRYRADLPHSYLNPSQDEDCIIHMVIFYS